MSTIGYSNSMGRPKEFDREVALEQAMTVFWERGYDAPTMTELRLAMGLGRQSLYDSFGDKRELFQQSLDHYLRMLHARCSDLLSDEDGIRAVVRYATETVEILIADQDRKGCLMFNTCMGVAPHDEKVRVTVNAGVKHLRRSFESALRRAVADGRLSADTQVAPTAAFLVSQLAGMSVLARSGASKRELRAVLRTALSILD